MPLAGWRGAQDSIGLAEFGGYLYCDVCDLHATTDACACMARDMEEQSRVLQRLQEGVLEVHQVEFTAAVKGLEERQELKWAASNARVAGVGMSVRARA